MEITLLRANIDNAKELHAMQVEAFKELLEKYQDFGTNPGNENWELDTILQESKNCYLYEKMGYCRTGKTEVINERLTLVFYEKKGADIT